MRVVQFVQVVVLLILVSYGVLIYLENPVLVRLPLLVSGREAVVPAGIGLALALLVGALYALLLILPRYLRQRLLRRGDLNRRRDAETRLQATLQAVIDGAAGQRPDSEGLGSEGPSRGGLSGEGPGAEPDEAHGTGPAPETDAAPPAERSLRPSLEIQA
ncbi:hypothetical protein [Deinococcus sp.]|uniref:hypothetical protein n=1 Tax=Deinococcus sp. TaxID=47478 RepID=UPI003CC514A7